MIIIIIYAQHLALTSASTHTKGAQPEGHKQPWRPELTCKPQQRQQQQQQWF
jgi:hypothetical protein